VLTEEQGARQWGRVPERLTDKSKVEEEKRGDARTHRSYVSHLCSRLQPPVPNPCNHVSPPHSPDGKSKSHRWGFTSILAPSTLEIHKPLGGRNCG